MQPEYLLKCVMKRYFKILSVLLIANIPIVLVSSCSGEKLPEIATSAVTGITITSATGGGIITDEGSSVVVSLVVCWSIDPGPTVKDFKTSEMAGLTRWRIRTAINGYVPSHRDYLATQLTDQYLVCKKNKKN